MSEYGIWTGIANFACSGLSRSGRRWSAVLSPNEGGSPPGEGGSNVTPDDWRGQSDVVGKKERKSAHGRRLLQENVTNKVQIFVRIIIIVITLCDVKASAAAKAVRALVEQKQKCRNRAYQSNADRPEIPSTSFQALQNGQRYSLSCEGCGLLRNPEKMSMYGIWTGIAKGTLCVLRAQQIREALERNVVPERGRLDREPG